MVNHEGYHRRMDAVRDILAQHGLEGAEITPIEYFATCPFPFNSFIYKVVLKVEDGLPSPASAAFLRGAVQPCTVLPPVEGLSTVVVRLSNPRAHGLNNTNRVENEVAALHLARVAVAHLGPDSAGLVPAVYAWKAAASPDPVDETGFGWMLMEFVQGVPLDAHFRTLSVAEKKGVVGQIAAIFSAIQSAELPSGVGSYGGLKFDDRGAIVSGQPTLAKGGPWEKYEDFWKAKFQCELEQAEENEVMNGWYENGIRERINSFINTKLDGLLRRAGITTPRLALIHGDLTMNNMLVDPKTSRITSCLDFDWAYISHPAEELLFSLRGIGGNHTAVEGEKLRKAVLTGDFDEVDDDDESQVAKAFDDALRKRNAIRSSDVPGMETLGKLARFLYLLCPHMLAHCFKKTVEEIAEMRAKYELELVEALDEFDQELGSLSSFGLA